MKKFLRTGHRKITLFLLCMLLLIAMPAIVLAMEEPVSVTGVTLEHSELILTAGGAPEALTAAVAPEDATDQTVIWSSSDETVAIVADGVVTPLAAGMATITATTVDGDFTVACEVTVNAAVVPVTGVTLDQSELTLVAGGETETLTATVSPADATDQTVIWLSSDEAVATVDDGIVTPLAAGMATITATTADGDFTVACEVTVNDSIPFPKIGLTGANMDYPLISSSSDEVIVNYAANGDSSYEWYYSEDYSTVGHNAYIAGNSGQTIACVSNISITVSGAGSFSIDYMTSTYGSGDGYALYYKVGEPITQENYKTADNYDRYSSFRGIREWTAEQFNIKTEDLDDEGKATIYIAYLRAGTLTGNGSNTVAIANVCFTSGEKTLTLSIDDSEYGYVTDADNNTYSSGQSTINYNSGDTVALTAIPEAGRRFYGWVDGNGKFLTTDETYSFTISSDITLKAVFGLDGSYVARCNGVFYTDIDGGLAQALADAEPGDILVILENQTLSADAAVPANVRLYIPYSANFDEDGNADGITTSGSPYQASTRIATSDKTYRTLTINSGVTLTVNGTLNIGGVISYPGQYYNGHTSGWHGKIENDGDIVIESGGTLECWGFITGSGTVAAQSGSLVYEPFIVYDFAGGWNTAQLYFEGQSPFKQYAMQNIQTPLVINSGSKLYARCNLWASSKYNKTDIIFIGEKGMYQLANGATVTRTYDGTKHISTNTDIGKTTYTFSGGMAIDSLSLKVMGISISTEDVEFPVSYNTDMVLENGDYFSGKIKLMPGGTMRVGNDANLIVDGTFFVLDGLIQSNMSGKFYPTTDTLQNAGFSASGQLFVNGSMIVEQDAIFGGVIQTDAHGENPSTVTIESGAIVDSTNVQDGAVGSYDVNTSKFDLPARAYIYDSAESTYVLKKLYPGRVYLSYDDTVWTKADYTMTYAVDCPESERSDDIPVRSGKYHKWVTEIVPLNESRIGSWDTAGYVYHNVQVVNKTIYDETDSTRTVVGDDNSLGEIESCGDVVFTVDITETGIGYGYQVTYVAGNADPIVLTADAEGQYTISEVKNDVTIIVTSCKLGDINFDGEIDNADLVQLRKTLAKILTPEDLQFIAADINRDGEIDNGDLVMLRKHLAKVIEIS